MKPKRWPLSSLSRLLTITLASMPAASHLHRRLLSTTGGLAVKNVTRSNFQTTLESMRVLVREADFVAFDLEMSGVTSAPWRAAGPLDDLDVLYMKVKDSAEKFAVFQFGLCPFRWDASKESFIARPHNFYLFPQPELPSDGSSSGFLCQTSSLDFLAKHQFDFNASIHDGISYISKAQESEARHAFSSTCSSRFNFVNTFGEFVEMQSVRTSDVLFMERMKNKFLEWHDGILRGSMMEEKIDCSRHTFQTIFFKMRPAVLLDGYSSHQHKLIQLVIRRHFKDLIYVLSSDESSSQKRVVVYSASDNDKTLLMKEVWEDLGRITEEKIKSLVGFRHIIDILASSQKLMVGHSCILDIIHMHNKFLQPLPSTMTEFAHSFHEYFPHVIDTKHFLENCEFVPYLDKKGNNKSLSSIFARLCPEMFNACSGHHQQPVKIEVPEDELGPWNSGKKHDAGYDAFMTGGVFIQTCAYLGVDFKLLSTPLELIKHEKLQKYENIVSLYSKCGTEIDLKTGIETQSALLPNKRRYPKVEVTNIIVIWGFSPKIKPIDVKLCISKIYGPDSVASVYCLGGSAVLVQFSKQELVGKFLELKDSLERDNNLISVLHPLSTLLEGGNTRAANYDVYKEICSSPMSKFQFADQAMAVGIRWMNKLEISESQAFQTELNDRDVSQSRVETSLNSQNETAEKTNQSSNSAINAYRGSSFPAESSAHLSYRAILDSLNEFSGEAQKQTW